MSAWRAVVRMAPTRLIAVPAIFVCIRNIAGDGLLIVGLLRNIVRRGRGMWSLRGVAHPEVSESEYAYFYAYPVLMCMRICVVM